MVHYDLTFRLFINSPFSDMIAERKALQEHIFPNLREYCQQRNARFKLIDLRWGVAEEAALDQQTMNICIRELHRCQELSPRPNFIVLLGDRYGWRPLPPQINAAEFEMLIAKLSDNEKQHLLHWYRRDDNTIPPEYSLLPRTGEFVDHARWATEEDGLRAILLKSAKHALNADDPELRKYYDSATHQEIRHGALKVENPQSHVFCHFREIEDLPENDSAKQYRDIRDNEPDDDAQRRLDELKTELQRLLPPDHVHHYKAIWHGDHPEWDLGKLCEEVERDLKQVIDQELAALEHRPDLEREIEAHREFAEDHCRHFVGRQNLLRSIRDYLTSSETAPLIIHGKSGSGKTALMAKAWLDEAKEKTAVARFIGATPGSSDLRTLLTSLCRQIGVQDVPTDMNELVRAFRDRLLPAEKSEATPGEREPVMLFLDAPDQLNLTDNARMLYWLPRELAANVKLVLSVLEKDPKGEKPNISDDCFDVAGRIWPGRLAELGSLDEVAGVELLDAWLAQAGRTLQPPQRADVLYKFKVCPFPLYMKLAFEEVRQWKSWEGLPCGDGAGPGLRDSVEGVLGDLFHRLERPQNHGHTLVSRALGYIAAGKNGLTEDELLDILSTDKEVMADFYNRSPESSRVDRIPVVIWSRLFADIEPYMTRRRADGTVVMDFYHRQVGEAIQERYLASYEAHVKAHLHLAEYFHGLDYWAESLEAQRARAKRLPPTPRPVNVRKVVELPYHRLEVAKLAGKDDPKSPYWDAVADLLTDWQFLEAKAEADPNFREQESREPLTAEEAKP
jgi:hypothetical protein